MRRRLDRMPFIFAAIAGLLLFLLEVRAGLLSTVPISDFFFAFGSGFLVVGLIRMLSNLRMFASLLWGTRMLKRLFLGQARSGREETEDYAAFRKQMGGHEDAKFLLVTAGILIVLSILTAFVM